MLLVSSDELLTAAQHEPNELETVDSGSRRIFFTNTPTIRSVCGAVLERRQPFCIKH